VAYQREAGSLDADTDADTDADVDADAEVCSASSISWRSCFAPS
jgi:hypothetical protein